MTGSLGEPACRRSTTFRNLSISFFWACETRRSRPSSDAPGRGDRSAVIFGSAHDLGAPAGPSLRERLAAIARGAGMALCGGGCMGFVNLEHGLRAIGYLEPDPLPIGPVAFVSHSGSAFSALLRTRRRLGFTLAVSSGQELVTPAASYVDYALDLPGTGIVALLLEALREPEALRSALARRGPRRDPGRGAHGRRFADRPRHGGRPLGRPRRRRRGLGGTVRRIRGHQSQGSR